MPRGCAISLREIGAICAFDFEKMSHHCAENRPLSRGKATARMGRRLAGLLGIFILLEISAPGAQAAGEIQHVVVFWLKRPQNSEDRAKVARASKELGALAGVLRVEVGDALPVRRPKLEQAFDMCAVFTFRDRAALKRYAESPEHRAVVESVLKPLVQRYVVFDFVAR